MRIACNDWSSLSRVLATRVAAHPSRLAALAPHFASCAYSRKASEHIGIFGANETRDNTYSRSARNNGRMPRKTRKRTAEDPTRADKAPKQIKKKPQVLTVKTDLRSLSIGGVMLVFGQGDFGQLGLGEDITEKTYPGAISDYQDIVAIAAGAMHNVCLRQTGEVLTFGCNDEGALGRDTSKEGSETVPDIVELPGKAIQVTAGDSHTAALLEDGRVFAWGSFRDTHGSMGLTLKGIERLPVEMLPEVKVIKIASGNDHLVFLSENGRVYTCGRGEQGQLGRVAARTASRDSRQGIGLLLTPGIVEFKIRQKLYFNDVWAGHFCTFAKEHKKGDIYVFGLNNFHQIGLKDNEIHFHPQVSKTFNGKVWKHISSGEHHTIALDDAGQVFVMGRKEYGRLGLGPNCSDAKELTLVPTLSSTKCIDVGAGSRESFAVTESGDLYSWGNGTNGSLGTGDTEDVEEPMLVKGKQLEGKAVVRVSGGGQHTLALATIRPVKEKTVG
ncbi:regulator of chromosome condensation isoform X2 [Monomorium pharaonis]|uniref:regulator of chromosome condensation isoform X2 n=1 Tax=Monomorium pharaonis TaxID=307658 RepID=UPI0017471138|nr:regulator of chromosome condensation isoform X2 [Monomorium pharaonis]